MLRVVTVALLGLSVSACTEDWWEVSDDDQGIYSDTALSGGGSQNTEIREFSIDTLRQDGAYDLSVNTYYRVGWDIQFGEEVRLSLYFSPSRSTNDPEADLLYTCDEKDQLGSCVQSVQCRYTNLNRLECTGGRSVDVSDHLFDESFLILRLSSQHAPDTRQTASEGLTIRLF